MLVETQGQSLQEGDVVGQDLRGGGGSYMYTHRGGVIHVHTQGGGGGHTCTHTGGGAYMYTHRGGGGVIHHASYSAHTHTHTHTHTTQTRLATDFFIVKVKFVGNHGVDVIVGEQII